MMKNSLRLNSLEKKLEKKILRGNRLDYKKGVAFLFLKEVESTMYKKIKVSEQKINDVNEVIITVQDHKFMEIAKKYNIWLPSSSAEYGLSTAMYVAYYETNDKGNKNPKSISHIAKIKTIWNRISFDDAKTIPELKPFLSSKYSKILTFKGDETFHIAITEKPIKLKNPIPLGRKNVARVLSRKNFSLIKFLNAETTDDLFT